MFQVSPTIDVSGKSMKPPGDLKKQINYSLLQKQKNTWISSELLQSGSMSLYLMLTSFYSLKNWQ